MVMICNPNPNPNPHLTKDSYDALFRQGILLVTGIPSQLQPEPLNPHGIINSFGGDPYS